jgi:hypothetical protein
MSDEPGPPVSPHGDSEPGDPRPPAGPHRPDGSGTDADGGSASWYLPPLEQPDFPVSRADYGRATSGYARRQADGPEAQPANTLPLGTGAPAASRLVRDPWTEIRHLTPTGPTTMKIGIWGSPASGKSTLLAALQHATGNADRSLGRWNLFPLTEESKELLVIWNQRLVTDRKFPEATSIAAEAELRWRFRGDLAGSKYQPPWHRLRRVPEPSNFDLDLIDVNGEVFGPRPTDKDVPVEVVTRTLGHLANAQGLIYLFDPITERETPTVAQYMNRPLAELASLVESMDRTIGGRLPHYISVCVTKFDDPRLFQQACRAGFVNTGRDGRPRVLRKHAKRFFDALCAGKFWEEPDERGANGPRFVRDMLRQYFHPARTRYYVTSSIGFNLGADGQFDPARYSMVREEEEEEGRRIIGPIEPINVLEPLVDLYMKLRRRV